MTERSMPLLVITLLGVGLCAATCFVLLLPYEAYRRLGRWLTRPEAVRGRLPRRRGPAAVSAPASRG